MTDMTVDQHRLQQALDATVKQSQDGSFLVAVRSDDLRVLRDAAARAPFSNLERAEIIGRRIHALEVAQKSFKRGYITTEAGSIESALSHPFYVQAEAEIRSLEKELALLI